MTIKEALQARGSIILSVCQNNSICFDMFIETCLQLETVILDPHWADYSYWYVKVNPNILYDGPITTSLLYELDPYTTESELKYCVRVMGGKEEMGGITEPLFVCVPKENTGLSLANELAFENTQYKPNSHVVIFTYTVKDLELIKKDI